MWQVVAEEAHVFVFIIKTVARELPRLLLYFTQDLGRVALNCGLTQLSRLTFTNINN